MAFKIPNHIDTTATIAGKDMEVRAIFDYSPAEPEVNAPEEVTLTGVWYGDYGDALCLMSPEEIEVLEEALLIEVNELLASEYELQQERRAW